MRKKLEDETFSNDDRIYFDVGDGDDSLPELDISIPKLRNKYNNLKKDWRKRVDWAKNGSDLRLKAEAMWFQILQPVMTDAHSTLDDLASGPKDTSFVQYQDDSLSGTDDESDENESSEDGEHYLLYTKYIAKPYFCFWAFFTISVQNGCKMATQSYSPIDDFKWQEIVHATFFNSFIFMQNLGIQPFFRKISKPLTIKVPALFALFNSINLNLFLI